MCAFQEPCNHEQSETPVNELVPDEDNSPPCSAEIPIVSTSTSDPSDRSDGTMQKRLHSEELLSANRNPLANAIVSRSVTNDALPDRGGATAAAASDDVLLSADKIPASSHLTVAIGEVITEVAEVESTLGAVADGGQLSLGACQSVDACSAVISVVPASGESVHSVNTASASCKENVPCSADMTCISKDISNEMPPIVDEVTCDSDIIITPSDRVPVSSVPDSAVPSVGELTVVPAADSLTPVSSDVMSSFSSEKSVMSTVHDVSNMSASTNTVEQPEADVLSVASQALSEESLSDIVREGLQISNDICGSGDVTAIPGEKPVVPATDGKTPVPRETGTPTGDMEDAQVTGTSGQMTKQICVAEVVSNGINQETNVLDGRVCVEREEDSEGSETRCSVIREKDTEADQLNGKHEASSCGDVQIKAVASGSLCSATETNGKLLDAGQPCLIGNEAINYDGPKEQGPVLESQGKLASDRNSISELALNKDAEIACEGLNEQHEGSLEKMMASEFEHDTDLVANIFVDSQVQLDFVVDSSSSVKATDVSRQSNDASVQSSDQSKETDDDDSDSTSSSSNLPELKLVGCLTDDLDSVTVNSVVGQVNVPRPVHLLKPNPTNRQGVSLQHPGEAASAPGTRMRFDQWKLDASKLDRKTSNRRSMAVLVSSSVIDVLCLLQRLTHIVETLGGALYCPQVIGQQTGDCEMENKMTELRTSLKERLAEVGYCLIVL